jgi:virulence factor BrkB
VFALVTTGIGLIFYFGPDADQDWVWISPGAVAATILWLLVSLLFKLYIANFTDYEATYGTVGGVIVVLLWFYVSGLAILAGAELNAEIEHASPYGKAPGQKSAQGKLLIGRRAARAFRERQRSIESRPMESASTRARGSHPATQPERTATSPVALRTLRSTEHRAPRQADLVRIAVNTLIAVGWMRLAWRSTGLFRRAAVGAVVIGTALALDTRRAGD